MADITPNRITIIPAKEKVQVADVSSPMTGQFGGWNAGSNELSKGKLRLQADQERILIGDTSAIMTGVGIYLGKDDSAYKFRIGDPDGSYMLHDGTDLTLVGGTISGGTISIGSGDNIFKADANGIYLGNATFASAPFRVTMAGVVNATGAIIDGTSTIGERIASTIAGAINASGNFVNDLINSQLDTSAKTILGDFTFGESGAIKMITDANNGLWISPTGILGKKGGDNTFTIGIDGTATFAGTLSGASGTFGTITAGDISGVTITGSTLQTGTSGANVYIQSSRITQRTGSTEVVYSDVGTYGGFWGLKDLSGNSIAYWTVRNSGAGLNFVVEVGDLYIQAADDVIFVGGEGNDIYPATNNVMSLGLGSNKWEDIQSTLINGADYGFEHNWYLTENYKVGIEEEGIAVLNPQNKLMMFIGETGTYIKGGSVKNLDLLPYTKTTVKQRCQMDRYPEKRNRDDDKNVIEIPDSTKSEIGGSKYIGKGILLKKNKINK